MNYENMPLHEWMARDEYWGALEAHMAVPAAGRLATAEAWAVSQVAGSGGIIPAFRQMQGTSGFEGRCLPLPAGEPLPVLGERDPGVLQLVYDERITYPAAGSRAARRVRGRAGTAGAFNMAAAAMEQPGSLQLQAGVEVEPGVVVVRSVRYARGIQLPFGGGRRYSGLYHVSLPVGSMAGRLDAGRPQRLQPRPRVHGELASRRTVSTTDRQGVVALSQIAVAYHLKPSQGLPPGGKPWWKLARAPGSQPNGA